MTLIRFTLEGPIVKSHWNTYVTISTTSFHISSAENSSKKPKPAYVDISTGLSHWGLYLSKSRWERGGVGPGKWREVKKRVTKRKLFIPCQKKRQKLFNWSQHRVWDDVIYHGTARLKLWYKEIISCDNLLSQVTRQNTIESQFVRVILRPAESQWLQLLPVNGN